MALELNGTTGVSLVQDGVVTAADLASGVGGKFVSYAIIADQKSSTTDGGTFTSGAWRIRDLNTEIADPDGIVSISSNKFSLGAGTYTVRWSCPAFTVNRHSSRLVNDTDASVIEVGSSEMAVSTASVATRSFGSARLTITVTKEFVIQHHCQDTASGSGFGLAADFDTEMYTIVEIFKEA